MKPVQLYRHGALAMPSPRPLPLSTLSALTLMILCALSVSATASAQYSCPVTTINYPTGFTGATGIQLNGSAVINNGAVQLTDSGLFEAGSVFYTTRVNTQNFTTDFDFQLKDATSDGFAFVMQSTGPNALGSSAGGLGYGNPPGGTGAHIVLSNAVLFDLHNNQGEGGNSVRVEQNGVTSGANAYDLTPYGLDLHSGHLFHVEISTVSSAGDGGITITDTVTGKVATISTFLFNNFDTRTGYVGFTGSTGGASAIQSILDWTYTTYSPLYVTDCTADPNPANVSFPSGFSGATGLQFNGGPAITGSTLQLTPGAEFEAGSVYATAQIEAGYNGFGTDFDFNLGDGVNGDGFTFVVQDQSLSAVGTSAGGLGYGPYTPGASARHISASQAVKFDLHDNAGEGANSTGFYLGGASPTTPAIDLSPSGINLHSGHTYHANLNFTYFSPYDGNNFTSSVVITLTDLTVYHVFQKTIPLDSTKLNIGEFDYIGFTAGTGLTPGSINILNWRLLSRK